MGNPKKRFIRIDLGGIESEFRAERVAKVKDLPTKIILGSGLGEMYNHFNSKVLEEMANALSEISFERFPKKQFGDKIEEREKGWDYESQRNNFILSKIDQINPHLQTYLAILLKDKGHRFYIESDVFGNELRRATKHVSKLENPDYTWIFKHLKQYKVGFRDLKSFFIDLTKRAIPTIDSDKLLEVGKHFYSSTNSFYSLMFFEEYIRREGSTKLGNVTEIYRTSKGSNMGRRELYKIILAHSPNENQDLPGPWSIDMMR